MNIKSKYIEPKFKKESNPRIGLLALSTDLTIERDFQSICHSLPINLFVNRIHNENPLTKENEHMINSDTLELMKPTSLFINTSRGGLVNENDLANALRSGKIAGAALDVLSSEPPEIDHPLMSDTIPNLLITPHIAWISLEARMRLLEGVISNIKSFISGNPSNRVA